MTSFLVLLAEASNALSGIVIVTCLLVVTLLIVRFQGDGWGGTSVVRPQHRPVQVAMDKIHVAYTLSVLKSEPDEVRVLIGSSGRPCRVVVWWGAPRHELAHVLHDPWRHYHDTVTTPPQHWAHVTSQVLVEGDHKIALKVPQLDLGPCPREKYPLVVMKVDPSCGEDGDTGVGSVVSVLHVPDETYPQPTRVLYQYLKQRTGQLTLVTTLFTQSNGVNRDADTSSDTPPASNDTLPSSGDTPPEIMKSVKHEKFHTNEISSLEENLDNGAQLDDDSSLQFNIISSSNIRNVPVNNGGKRPNVPNNILDKPSTDGAGQKHSSDLDELGGSVYCTTDGVVSSNSEQIAAAADVNVNSTSEVTVKTSNNLDSNADPGSKEAESEGNLPASRSLSTEEVDNNLSVDTDETVIVQDSAAHTDERVPDIYDNWEQAQEECVVCQISRASLALLPCRHVCVCQTCFDHLMAKRQTCPMCRQPVAAFFVV